MMIDYRYIEALSPGQRNVMLIIDILILLTMFCVFSFHVTRKNARERRIREETEQNRERIAAQKRLEKEKLQKEQDAQRRKFLESRQFHDLRDMIFLDSELPRHIELAEQGLFLQYSSAKRAKVLDWDELPVSRVKNGHMRLANEALAVLCQENDQRYHIHYITNDCVEIVLNP